MILWFFVDCPARRDGLAYDFIYFFTTLRAKTNQNFGSFGGVADRIGGKGLEKTLSKEIRLLESRPAPAFSVISGVLLDKYYIIIPYSMVS